MSPRPRVTIYLETSDDFDAVTLESYPGGVTTMIGPDVNLTALNPNVDELYEKMLNRLRLEHANQVASRRTNP